MTCSTDSSFGGVENGGGGMGCGIIGCGVALPEEVLLTEGPSGSEIDDSLLEASRLLVEASLLLE